MTVYENRSDDLGYLVCSWFEGTARKQGNFSPEYLTSGQNRENLRIISEGDGGVWIG